ncbi:MAG: helix-turn-helix transcriptional regulator [Pseudomonas sp.]|uniref:helix-turn-helix domain-containing protein n=1 Tax=Pseudomonas sp. TaxID=306 RepID=UPI0030F2C85B
MKNRASEISSAQSAGERLREERTRLGANQEDFAQIGGVNRNTQGAYEKDERNPDVKYLAALAARGVDVLYVVTGERVPMKSDGLTVEEAELLLAYRVMSEADRLALSRVAGALAKSQNR